jgi:uncharacterized protein involved in exopolysaccharide biosynthesis
MDDGSQLRVAAGEGEQTTRVADAVPLKVSPAPGGRPPEDPVLRAGRRRIRWLIGGSIALLLSVTSIWTVFDASSYEARAALLIRAPGAEAGVPQAIDGALQSEREVLQSFDVLRRTLESIRVALLYPDLTGASFGVVRAAGVTRMRDSLRVRTPPGTDVIEVTFRHADPELAAEVVNRLVKRFRRARQKIAPPVVSRSRLHERIGKEEEALSAAEAALAGFLEARPDLAEDNPRAALIEGRVELERELRTQRWIEDHLMEQPLDDAPVRQARARLEEVELELEAARVTYASTSIEVANLKRKVEGAREHLEAKVRTARRERERSLQVQREQVERVETKLYEFDRAEQALPALERERRELIRSRDLAKRRLDVFQREFEEATLAAEVGRHRLANAMHVLTHARPPEARTVPPEKARMAWALLGVALVVVLAVIAADVVDDHRVERTAPVLYAAQLGRHTEGQPIALRVPEALAAGQRPR